MNEDLSNNSLPPKYADKYVAFVDILGFAGIVEASTKSAEQVQRLNQALSRLSANTKDNKGASGEIQATNFSDTIVLSCAVGPEGLEAMFEAITGFTVDLLSMKMLLRGAIVRGELLHSSDVTFGPALIAAYKLETSVSFHPRVMLDAAVKADIDRYSNDDKTRSKFEKYIVAGGHDVPHLNPFAAWHDEEMPKQESVESLINLQTIIANGLLANAQNPGICEKYKWLARKLNSFVATRGLKDRLAVIDID